MVRIKKRYFVVQFDLAREIEMRRKRIDAGGSDVLLDLADGALVAILRELVHEVHGDHGRAVVTQGMRAVYVNPATRLALVSCRHGEAHKLLASTLPFLKEIRGVKVVPRLIYTGATIRNCYKQIEKHQRRELNLALSELKDDDQVERDNLKAKILTLKQMERH